MNPLQLVQQIPAGMAIPALRDRLVRIIAEFRTQTSLSEGCNVILRHDCLVLAQVRSTSFHPCCTGCWLLQVKALPLRCQ